MQGYIRKRGKNSWQVCVNLGRDPLTRRRRQRFESVKGGKKDAEAVLTKLLHERDVGIDIEPNKLTVAGYLQRWLVDYAQPNTAPKTHLRYAQLLRGHVIPVIGALPLAKVRPLQVQMVHARIVEAGLSKTTALHCHRAQGSLGPCS